MTKDGELIGAGTVDETGTLELEIWQQPLLPGTAHLVVMAQNRVPYETDINVIVPATIYIDPMEIDANVTTDISVGVFEQDGVTPRPGVEIWAEGLDYESDHAFTDATGYCTITVTYPYGPTLDIVGQDPAEPWELFREAITVHADPMMGAGLTVTTDIGLTNSFALNLPGTIQATVPVPSHTLWAFLNEQPGISTTATTLEMTPDELGTVRAVIAVSGYDLFVREFPVIEAYGTLTGHVDAAGSPAVGAVVQGYDAMMELAFEAVADAQGDYDVGEEILVAPYTIKVDYFGFLPYEEPFFVNYGENVHDIALQPAPAGVLTGTVTEAITGDPLEATVKVYRSDTGELYAETSSSPLDGSYTTPALPYFDYRVTAKAWHHIPETIDLTVWQPEHTHDFVLEETIGDLLIVDDASGKGFCPDKIDAKTGRMLAAGYAPTTSKSAADIRNDLEDLGFTVTLEALTVTDPITWPNYDLLLVSSGANTTTLNDPTFRSALVDFVEEGGHLLLEGGEVAYDHQNDGSFAATVMHINDWTHDQSGQVTVVDPNHYVMSVPNTITGPINMSYSGYGDQDAVIVAADAARIGGWTTYPNDGSVIAYDPNPAPEGGQIIFFTFNYSAMAAEPRVQLLENAVHWLMTPEFGDASVSGRVFLLGQQDHSGVRVEASPGGGHVFTNEAGEYELDGLFNGEYVIKASKDGWSTEVAEVTLESGQHMPGINFVLVPVFVDEFCRQPNLPIPDNNPTGVSDAMEVALGPGVTVSNLEVYIHITHTYQGDLLVKLSSPAGTEVTLHNLTGGGTDNIIGWYPSELEPAESLDAFVGEEADGIWTLHVSDHAGADVGTLNEWCLRITHGESFSGAEERRLPRVIALRECAPNPMSRATTIRFDLPREERVDLAVYDISGRRVATLVSGPTAAGQHQVSWNGLDETGRPAPANVYFYRLRTGEETLTRKLMLLR